MEEIYIKQGCDPGRQWAFVTFASPEQASNAVEMTNGVLQFTGSFRPCEVTLARHQGLQSHSQGSDTSQQVSANVPCRCSGLRRRRRRGVTLVWKHRQTRKATVATEVTFFVPPSGSGWGEEVLKNNTHFVEQSVNKWTTRRRFVVTLDIRMMLKSGVNPSCACVKAEPRLCVCQGLGFEKVQNVSNMCLCGGNVGLKHVPNVSQFGSKMTLDLEVWGLGFEV